MGMRRNDAEMAEGAFWRNLCEERVTCWTKVSDQALLGGGQEVVPNTSNLREEEV